MFRSEVIWKVIGEKVGIARACQMEIKQNFPARLHSSGLGSEVGDIPARMAIVTLWTNDTVTGNVELKIVRVEMR